MTKPLKHKSQTPLLLPAPASFLSRFFPQYTRLFAANPFFHRIRRVTGLILWVLLACAIGINIAAAQDNRRFSLTIPFFADKSDVLGDSASTHPPDLEERVILERRYDYWTEVLRDNPDYRDAHYQAALIAFQLGDNEKMREHMAEIKELDPNFLGIQSLEELSNSLSPKK
ncbi:MAG: hypothetical protein ACOY3M_00945 [Patescibacteria group bacterium]